MNVLVRAPRAMCSFGESPARDVTGLAKSESPKCDSFGESPDVTVLVRAPRAMCSFGKSPARDVTGLAKSESPYLVTVIEEGTQSPK